MTDSWSTVLTGPIDRFVFDAHRPILSQRLDPVMSPGHISSHEVHRLRSCFPVIRSSASQHRVLGASSFSATYNSTALRESPCTSIAAQADKSNYWQPMLYKVIYDPVAQKSQYAPMWGQTRLYYNFPQLLPGTGPGTYVEPFPDDFQVRPAEQQPIQYAQQYNLSLADGSGQRRQEDRRRVLPGKYQQMATTLPSEPCTKRKI